MVTVILDHPRFLVINKPAGIGMHQEGEAPGIVSQVKTELNLPELYPVHRLDKVTSGALILAKDPEANSELSGAFRHRQVEKYYLALSDRRPSKKQGLVAGDMERSRRSSWKLLHSRKNPAVTQFISGSFEGPLRWFLLKPATGKTHQIRVALKSLGAPILGDQLYGPAVTDNEPADRTYLHAWALRFPFQGEKFDVVVPPDCGALFQHPQLQQAMAEHTPPWELNWPSLPSGLKATDGSDGD